MEDINPVDVNTTVIRPKRSEAISCDRTDLREVYPEILCVGCNERASALLRRGIFGHISSCGRFMCQHCVGGLFLQPAPRCPICRSQRPKRSYVDVREKNIEDHSA
ncbi:hypothetical protein AVEN_111460-1 [Araneus ventricosus]|uniref:RING-type domain-containing protein n=1 Tax=Araneus ventricosus TaxID=182803 RepID=A0A4Y2K133_ARAVE|nr:hypothetical protein AVEN_111460-1 [Araneus ventricosus]